MNALDVNILGFPAVNNDLLLELRDPLTREVITSARPYSDGSARMAKVPPGAYELTVKHPNVVEPVAQRGIRVLHGNDTRVSVLIDPSRFRNTPIKDIPDANLRPVRDQLSSVAETVLPLGNKLPGEAIRSADFNALAHAIRDIALAVSELSRLVTPVGHNHGEYEKRLGEMQTNFDTLVSTLTVALTELQRQIQAQRVRVQVQGVLDRANIAYDAPEGVAMLDAVRQLEEEVTASPTYYSRRVRDAGQQLATHTEALIDKRASDDPKFAELPETRQLVAATDLLRTLRPSTYDTELSHYRKVDQAFGGALPAMRK